MRGKRPRSPAVTWLLSIEPKPAEVVLGELEIM
jgi:hypothetical protein